MNKTATSCVFQLVLYGKSCEVNSKLLFEPVFDPFMAKTTCKISLSE